MATYISEGLLQFVSEVDIFSINEQIHQYRTTRLHLSHYYKTKSNAL